MCLNKRNLFFLIILYACFFPCNAFAGPLKVSLLLGDGNSRIATETVKNIKKEHASLQGVSFKVYPAVNIRTSDIDHLRDSQLVIILITGRQLAEAVKPELLEVIRKGGKVYAVGMTYYDDHKQIGIRADEKMRAYYAAGGMENLRNMVLYALKKDFELKVTYGDLVTVPESGIYEHKTKRVFGDFEEYRSAYLQGKGEAPSADKGWVGIVFSKSNVDSAQTRHIDALCRSLEERGFGVIPVYGFPYEAGMERYFFDKEGKGRVKVIVALGLKIGVNPDVTIPLLARLGVPVIDAITLYSQSESEWRKSPVGLDIFERGWQISLPEMGGIIQPTVIASKERITDEESGFEYIEESPIPERINMLTDRVSAWVNLQVKPAGNKNIAIIYYNYPPGKHEIGASYLNVLPESLWEMTTRLKSEGYNLGDKDFTKDDLFHMINSYSRNIGNWAQGELNRVATSGYPELIPLDTYRKWFNELPEALRNAILKDWGPVEDSNIMIWEDDDGKKYLVIPAMKYGNVLFTPQPSRGWEQDPKKLYHDITVAPHHQYVAFYLWLKKGYNADAVVHVGTHGTIEWLSGKEVGFTNADPPEALIRDLPNAYIYIVDDIGEGLQAKRRSAAVIIDHMTPPFDKAGLNVELKELAGLINDYNVAKEKSPSVAEAKLNEINRVSEKTGLLKDLQLEEIRTVDEIEEIEHYIKEIAEKQTPFGMHTFGRAPDERYRKSTAEAIVSVESGLKGEEREKKIAELEARIVESAQKEMDALIQVLSGRYILAGSGNDPIRNPDSLPTGKNFYAFDPRRVPSKETYAMGVKLATDLIEGYKQRHGAYPDKLTFNLWGVETSRHEGAMESQIMYLMGIRPRWDERGAVTGVEVIPRKDLGRPRIDVTIVPSGLFRDLFSNLMDLLDKAVTLAKDQDEEDNLLRAHMMKTKKMLMEKGVSEEMAGRLASVRLFTVPSGAYGTNLDKVIPLSNTWESEKEVAGVYFMRMSHMYGQGFWGSKISSKDLGIKGEEDISLAVFETALSGSRMAVHSRSGNVYAALDGDDFFQYLGGTSMAIRSLDGKSPEVYVTNMSNPGSAKQETLEKYMGREMRTRYLNPEWIRAMMKEGYSGARFMHMVTDNLWGWQVTVPEAVDAAKWNEMYETYVLDRNGLEIKKFFRESNNMWAYQTLVARMIETTRKGYWKPEDKVVETLSKEFAETAGEVGLACGELICNNPRLTSLISSVLMTVPGFTPQAKLLAQSLDSVKNPSRPQSMQREAGSYSVLRTVPAERGRMVIKGYEIQDITHGGTGASAPIPYLFIAGSLGFVFLIVIGWRMKA